MNQSTIGNPVKNGHRRSPGLLSGRTWWRYHAPSADWNSFLLHTRPGETDKCGSTMNCEQFYFFPRWLFVLVFIFLSLLLNYLISKKKKIRWNTMIDSWTLFMIGFLHIYWPGQDGGQKLPSFLYNEKIWFCVTWYCLWTDVCTDAVLTSGQFLSISVRSLDRAERATSFWRCHSVVE